MWVNEERGTGRPRGLGENVQKKQMPSRNLYPISRMEMSKKQVNPSPQATVMLESVAPTTYIVPMQLAFLG